MTEHLWIPDAATITQAQSTALALHLGHGSYEELLAGSVAEPERFWDATARWLDLGWETPWTQVLDASDGMAWARWSCQSDEPSVAIEVHSGSALVSAVAGTEPVPVALWFAQNVGDRSLA